MMWRAAYTALLALAMPWVLLRLWRRGSREPGYRQRIAERFGFHAPRAESRPCLWVHAVSVGEARASAPLLRGLAAAYPQHDLFLTCTTAAGREALRELHGDAVPVGWLPYDLPGAVGRFLDRVRPALCVIMETEIWPNLLAACADRGLPVLLANARMSDKSARGYARLPGLSRPAIASLAASCAQSEDDARRLRELGARNVVVTGNLKFDAAPDAVRQAAGRAWRETLGRPVLLLASTRDGEERQFLEALPEWDRRLLVVIVPRHPRRFDEVAALAARAAGAARRRSSGTPPAATERVYVGDTMGEMDFYLGAADVAIIGGSFVPLGGQNLIEACAAGVPVVFGPSMFNFAEASRLALDCGAAHQARDAAGAVAAALRLLASAEARASMGEAGMRMCAAHRGAVQAHLLACRGLLP